MSLRRIAIVFDNTLRPETTGWYCRRALAKLVREGLLAEAEHFLPEELDEIPAKRFDLFLVIDDGLRYDIPKHLRPIAWWAIDTHIDFSRTLKRAWESDFVFAAQRDGAERFRRGGLSLAIWLPLACDPKIHRPHPVGKVWDVAFVGHELSTERRRLLRLVRQEFPSHFAGQAYREAMARIYSAARIVLNRSVENDINMRVFEGLASGSLLLTNDLSANGQAELFEAGRHLVTYGSDEELFDKARFYLKHKDERERIAQAGVSEVYRSHTYRHRMETLLRTIETAVAKTALSIPQTLRSSKCTLPTMSSQDATCYEFARPEVLALIPTSARRVLDVGCGTGQLGAALKQRQPATVIGIEQNPDAAKEAKAVLDDVLPIDLMDPDAPCPLGPFDAIICADVLEHLTQPQLLLERLRSLLSPEGVLIASLPNVQHHSAVRSLSSDKFTDEPAALLDEDHETFLAHREIENLLSQAGFTAECIPYQTDAEHRRWIVAGKPKLVRLGSLEVEGESPEEIEAFYVYQRLIEKIPSAFVLPGGCVQ